jgi:glycosyltransferase involved in cell wall biosynthesis
VRALARELGVDGAVHLGTDLSTGQLAAWYADADVFVSMSEHEGFGIPLVEAMAAGLPVVAHGAGAVAETVGGAGIVLPTNRPGPAAVAVHRVLTDPGLAATLATAGRRRLDAFAPDRVRARFVDVLGSVATGAVAA